MFMVFMTPTIKELRVEYYKNRNTPLLPQVMGENQLLNTNARKPGSQKYKSLAQILCMKSDLNLGLKK